MVEIPWGLKDGIFTIFSANEVEVFFVKDRAILGSYTCPPEDISNIVVDLLAATTTAHFRNENELPEKVEPQLANNPIPATTFGLLPNRKQNQVSLSLAIITKKQRLGVTQSGGSAWQRY